MHSLTNKERRELEDQYEVMSSYVVKLRIITWYNHLRFALGAQSSAAIADALGQADSCVRVFQDYAKAKREPSRTYVAIANQKVPGSIKVLDDGPFESRLWVALSSPSVYGLLELIAAHTAQRFDPDHTALFRVFDAVAALDSQTPYFDTAAALESDLKQISGGDASQDNVLHYFENVASPAWRRTVEPNSIAQQTYRVVSCWIALYRIARLRTNRKVIDGVKPQLLDRLQRGLSPYVDPFGLSDDLIELYDLFDFDVTARTRSAWLEADWRAA